MTVLLDPETNAGETNSVPDERLTPFTFIILESGVSSTFSPWLSAEKALGEEIQDVPPLRRVVRVAVHMPDVRDILLLQIGMHALADTEQAILVAAGDPEQFQLLPGGRRIGHQLLRR